LNFQKNEKKRFLELWVKQTPIKKEKLKQIRTDIAAAQTELCLRSPRLWSTVIHVKCPWEGCQINSSSPQHTAPDRATHAEAKGLNGSSAAWTKGQRGKPQQQQQQYYSLSGLVLTVATGVPLSAGLGAYSDQC